MKNIFLLLILLCSCQKSDSYFKETHHLLEIETLVFPIDQTTKRYGNKVSYDAGSNSLCIYNAFRHSFQFYRLSDKKQWLTIELEKSGPNGVKVVDHFKVNSLDSIVAFSSKTKSVYLINRQGAVFNKKKLFDEADPLPPLVPTFDILGTNLYFPVIGYNGTSQDYRSKSVFQYDMKTNNKSYLMDIPEEYDENWKDRTAMRYGTLDPNKKRFIVAFPMGSKINSIDLDTKQVELVDEKSKFLHEVRPYEGEPNDREQKSRYNLTNSWYESLYYASDQDVLLRSSSIGKDIADGDPLIGDYLSKNGDRTYVLIEIFNKDLVKIAEVPGNVFYGEIFSNHTGIYMADYIYDIENEDIIVFKKYKIEQRN